MIRGEKWQLTTRETQVPTEPWQLAQGFLHVPYLWGGRSDCGLDCSGLTQVIFKIKGIKIPRDAAEQALLGNNIEFGKQLPSDLAFFHNAEGKITHVGIVTKTGFIHASGRVREDDLTADGIICRDNGKQSHSLSFIKRL
jgi:cell wall-associated NlpC family hydrolase